MGKYIDSEKMIALIEGQKKHLSVGRLDERGAIIAYGVVLGIITVLQQEQPEVDLEKFTERITAFQARYNHPESISIKGAMAFMARMFYQYPNTAREWYDNLPKATMD